MGFLRRHFGAVLTSIALTALVLGTIGFMQVSPTCTVSTGIYRAVQMFYWNYFPWDTTAEARLPWTLELGRFLAPVATLGALCRVAIALSQRRWDAFRVSRMSGHTVICGAGGKGSALAAELVAKGHDVVLVEMSEERSEELIGKGALVITGDATRTEVLQRAAVDTAARLVITTPGDHENLTIAMTGAHLAGAGTLAIHAHSSNAALCDLYQRNQAMAASVSGAAAVRVFNHFRDIARCTIADFPPDAPEGEAHVILPDLAKLGTALAVEYALVGHFTRHRRIHLHVIGTNGESELAILKNRFPGIEHCVEIEAIDLPLGAKFANRAATVIAAAAPGDCFTIFPGLEEETQAFSHALELLERMRQRPGLRVLLPHKAAESIRRLVEMNRELGSRIAFLPGPERTCSAEAIIGEALDRTARRVHENWLRETRSQIDAARGRGDEAAARSHEAKATYRSWDDLTEEQKGASRSQADHIPFKIRSAGLDPATVTPAQWSQLSPEQIEAMARMEHARWAAYYWMTGWTFAPERNDERKEHPNLVAYDDLDEPTEDYDRAAVRNLGEYLG